MEKKHASDERIFAAEKASSRVFLDQAGGKEKQKTFFPDPTWAQPPCSKDSG